MCQDCSDEWGYEKVSLVRNRPKFKVSGLTPTEYLEKRDEYNGLYALVEEDPVYGSASSEVVGYYTSYEGARTRQFSQPMFTYKTAGESCTSCENPNMSPDEREYLTTYHPADRRSALRGCICGNVAYTGIDCEEHPAPSAESRWVRLNQDGTYKCYTCDQALPQENWTKELKSYCSTECLEGHVSMINRYHYRAKMTSI